MNEYANFSRKAKTGESDCPGEDSICRLTVIERHTLKYHSNITQFKITNSKLHGIHKHDTKKQTIDTIANRMS